MSIWRTVKRQVSVTADMIRKGEPHSNNTCPVACGMLAAGFKEARVHIHFCTFRNDDTGDSVSLALPLEAQSFVRDFDAGLPVSPFSFPLSYEHETWV